MYAKPTCPTPLKILLVVVIVVELAAIGLLLAGRAGASEGRDSAVEASASTTPAPTDTPAAPAASDGGETAGGDKASAEPVTLTVTFAGDCTLGTDINYENERSFNSRWQAEEGDATYFLCNVADLFGADDLTVVNMEGALTEGGERADKKFAFRGKPEYAKILSSASVEAATLANNHSQDYGQTGYDDTIAALDAEGVQSFGYDRIAYLDVKGVKVALIGSYFPEDSAENTKEMTDNIAAACAEGAQLVIVYVHWGQEHEYDITEGQQTAGRIGAGSTGLRLVAPFQHHGPGAVAEQDARGALFPVDELAQALGGHHEYAAHVVAAQRRPGAGGFLAREGGAGHDEVSGGKPVDAAGAGAGHVVAHGVCGTDALADAGGLGGEVGVGGECRADDHVQAGGIDRFRLALPAALIEPQRSQRGLGAQIGAGLLDGDMAGVNARARDDPLVGGVYDFRELVVGDDARGQRSARSDDDAAQSRSFP